VVRIETTGGGGWGDPFEREPELVLLDVLKGKISHDAARNEYGVVIAVDPQGEAAVQAQATEHERDKLRAARAGKRPMIDRGAGEEVA